MHVIDKDYDQMTIDELIEWEIRLMRSIYDVRRAYHTLKHEWHQCNQMLNKRKDNKS